MTVTAEETICPCCGATLDAAVANGICPACLLKQAALGTGADSSPAMPWTPPSVKDLAGAFPQLDVLELIGQGGMGAVYKARQKSLERMVALKILAPQHAANPDFAERFSREAQVLAEANHPNIVTVHDFGRAGEFYFLLMEYVDGINLRQAMTAGRLTPQQALAIVPPICEALQFAHNRGVVHRDIKPENLLLDKTGRIKIADFGIARLLRNGPEVVPARRSDMAPPAGLTQESVLGTPQYMAPEQRDRPATVDHRADIFSLGVVLYEMLTGELPGPLPQPPSSKVQIDVHLDEIVLRALQENPELRFQSATELRTQVETTVIGFQKVSAPPRERFRHWPRVRIIAVVLGIGLTIALATVLGAKFAFDGASVAADVLVQQASVDQGHFSFHHEVNCPPGWNAWLTVENCQLIKTDSPRIEDRRPVIVSRYQAMIEGHGRVRVPIDYLPTSDEGRDKMQASIWPWSGNRAVVKPNVGISLLVYTTESGINVHAVLQILPKGKSPDSLLVNFPAGTPRFQSIEPLARPKLAPFEGAYDQGKVELFVLGPHPSKDQPCWKPNGEPAADGSIPDHGGKSWAAGKVIKEIAVRVQSGTGLASQPVLRFRDKSAFSGMGTSFYQRSVDNAFEPNNVPFTTLIQTIACPPEARQTTIEIGVADGDWHSSLTFERHENQRQFSASKSGSQEGNWEGAVRTTSAAGETVPLSFQYSRRDDCETRLVYERADGAMIRLRDEGSGGGHGFINSITTLPVLEFARIRRFHVQSRPYQWIEFRNVSLELGHRTAVEVQGNAGVGMEQK